MSQFHQCRNKTSTIISGSFRMLKMSMSNFKEISQEKGGKWQ